MLDNKNIDMVALSDDDMDKVVGGMGVERHFDDMSGGECKCIYCGKILKASEASIHAATCLVSKQNSLMA